MSLHNTFSLDAPAKINLFLHVTGKRDDGYHSLQSLMVFLDIGDKIEFAPHDALFIDADGPFSTDLTNPQGNLIYKAAIALAEEYKIAPRGRMTLTKNLPIASGIGGGSSDAATALIGLSRLWGLPDDQNRLQKIARTLGADVPACLMRRPVWVEGAGEKVTALPGMPGMHFVLMNPNTATPTPEVFKRFRARFSPPIQFMGRRKTMQEWIADLKIYRNDLTEAASTISPLILIALKSLQNTPNCHFARLSGSGSTCFGVYDNPYAALAAVNKLRLEHPDWWIMPANIKAD